MKRYGNIYSKIYNYENLKKAHHKARKNKGHYSDVKMVNKDEEKFLIEQCEQYKNEMPFVATIKQVDKYYKFS
jgi:hypothetical protein